MHGTDIMKHKNIEKFTLCKYFGRMKVNNGQRNTVHSNQRGERRRF